MEETLSQYLKNKSTCSTMRSQTEIREKFVEGEVLTNILLMLLILVLNQEKLDFANFWCPVLSNLNISQSGWFCRIICVLVFQNDVRK